MVAMVSTNDHLCVHHRALADDVHDLPILEEQCVVLRSLRIDCSQYREFSCAHPSSRDSSSPAATHLAKPHPQSRRY